MNKIKVFLSSRVNAPFSGSSGKYTLKHLRQWLRDNLDTESLLGESLFDIVINETDFNSPLSKDAFDNCMHVMRSCNVIVILYNADAGWSVTGNTSTNGICHEEFLVAMNEFSDMSFALDLSRYFPPVADATALQRNAEFVKEVTAAFRHMETVEAESFDQLKTVVLAQVKKYLLTATEKSFAAQKRLVAGSGVFGETLDWSKLSYSEREATLKSKLAESFEQLPGLEHIVKAYYAVPDSMSTADARNAIGRPFIDEHKLILGSTEKSGVIHFVAVYGNVTITQVKSLVGYPDLTVIKAPFGFYLWEKTVHIQMFFLRNCINPPTVKTRLSETINWLNSSREQPKIMARAEARFSILRAINDSSDIKGLN